MYESRTKGYKVKERKKEGRDGARGRSIHGPRSLSLSFASLKSPGCISYSLCRPRRSLSLSPPLCHTCARFPPLGFATREVSPVIEPEPGAFPRRGERELKYFSAGSLSSWRKNIACAFLLNCFSYLREIFPLIVRMRAETEGRAEPGSRKTRGRSFRSHFRVRQGFLEES